MDIIKTKKKGSLVVISGPSGAGKDTIINELLKTYHNAWVSISATSRKPRPNEKEGVTYFYLTKKEFERRIQENDFLEYAVYNDNYYGTPKSGIVEKLNAGIDVILEIEIQGALKVKEVFKEAIFIFILPPTLSELRKRLVNRKTEDRDKIIGRFKTAYNEINEVTKYNYVVINDNLMEAVEKTKSILISEKCRVDRIEDIYLGNLEEELHEILIDKELDNSEIEI